MVEFGMLMRNAAGFDETVYAQGVGGVFTLDASDGSERWSVELEFGGVPGHMPTVYGGVVLFSDGTNDIRAVDADVGSAVWVRNVGESSNGASIVDVVDYTTSGNSRSRSIQPTGPSSKSGPCRRSSTGLSWTIDYSTGPVATY